MATNQQNFRVRNGLTIDGSTTGSSNFSNAATGADIDYVLPTAQGTANTALTNDGSGNLSWALPGGGGSTFGNITIAVVDDNTISTTTGDLLLDSVDNIIITGGIAPAVVTDPSPSVLTLESGQTTLAFDGGFGLDDSLLTMSSQALTWAHTAGMVFGSVNGTWNWNADGTTDFPNYTFPYADGTANQVLETDGTGNLSWVSPIDTNTTYTQDASVATGGANLNLVGSDATTDTIKFAGGTNVTVTATDANTITIDAPDTNTTYDFNATSTSGGANFNLVGSDATTDTVKLSNGGHITATYTSATEVTLGSDATDANTASTIVARDASGDFSASGATLGNITIAVADDNTISTTTGNLTLNSTGGNIILNSNGTLGMTLVPIALFNPNADFTGNIVKGAIRTGAGEATGDIFQGLSGATPSTGISIDNTDKVADRTSLVMRNYGASLSGGLPRNTIVWEAARGTAAAPSALGLNDSLGEIMATGYTSTGFIADQTSQITTGVIRLRAAEAWSSGLNNTGTQLLVALQPTATALAASSLVATLIHSPQATTINSNSVTIGRGSNTPVGGATLTMGGTGTTGGAYLQVGDVNIAAMNSSWQTVLTPGFKYTGLMSSSTQNSNGSTFEMSSRWKAAAADVAYVIPQNGWGLGKFSFSADNTTTNTNQVVCGEIKAKATENWSSLTTGSKLEFNANRQGAVGDGRVVFSVSPETTNLTSDVFNVYNTTTASASYGNVSSMRLNAGNPAGATFNDRTSQLRVTTASTTSGDASTIVFSTGNFNTGTGNYSASVAADTLGEFFFQGNYGTGSNFTTLGPSVRFAAQAAETFTGTNSGGRFVVSIDKIGGTTQYDAITVDSANASIASDIITLESNTGTDYLVMNSTSATFTQPVGFPVYTAATKPATGVVGQQISISDSPTSGGRMAFYDTTNSRWSYISDNTAV